MPSLPAETKSLLILAKALEKQKLKLPHSALCHVKIRVSLRYFENDCTHQFTLITWVGIQKNGYSGPILESEAMHKRFQKKGQNI